MFVLLQVNSQSGKHHCTFPGDFSHVVSECPPGPDCWHVRRPVDLFCSTAADKQPIYSARMDTTGLAINATAQRPSMIVATSALINPAHPEAGASVI